MSYGIGMASHRQRDRMRVLPYPYFSQGQQSITRARKKSRDATWEAILFHAGVMARTTSPSLVMGSDSGIKGPC